MNTLEILISGLILMIGIFTCYFLYRKKETIFSPTSDVGKRNIMVSIICVGLLCRLIFTFCVPANLAPDEKAHLNYIKYISENKTLPVQPDFPNAEIGDYEYYQPPLYYLTMALFYNLGNELNFSDNINIIQIRFLSIAMWLVTAIAAWLVVIKLELKSNFAELFVVALVSLLPSYMYISSRINNDNLMTCLSSLIFLFAVRWSENFNWKEIIALSIFSSLGLLTKYSGVLIFVFITILWAMKIRDERLKINHVISICLACIIISLLLVPFLLRNRELYGALIPLNVGASFPNWETIFYGVYRAFKNFLNTFWGVAGRTNNIKFIPAIVIGNIVAIIALYGTVKCIFTKSSYIRAAIKRNLYFCVAALLTLAIGFMMLIYFGVYFGQAQGRFLFPLIIPIGIWMAVGFKNVLGERVENIKFIMNTVMVFILSAVSFTAYILFRIHAS